MYKTTISSVRGNTAADTSGRSFYIAGNGIVMPGQQVWTDGKVLYGNTLPGTNQYIPTPIKGGIPILSYDGGLYIYDKHAKKFEIKDYAATYTVNNSLVFKGVKNANTFTVMDATISLDGDLLELGYYGVENYPTDQHPLILRKNGKAFDQILVAGYKNYALPEVEQNYNDMIGGILASPHMLEWEPREEPTTTSSVFVQYAVIHPDYSYNIYATVSTAKIMQNIHMLVGGPIGAHGYWDGGSESFYVRSAYTCDIIISQDGAQEFVSNYRTDCDGSKNGFYISGTTGDEYYYELPSGSNTPQNVCWKLDKYTVFMDGKKAEVEGTGINFYGPTLIDCYALPDNEYLLIDKNRNVYKYSGKTSNYLIYGKTYRAAYLKSIRKVLKNG